jgi:hydroxymethylbilane synthase
MKRVLAIGTRGSSLARCQAEIVRAKLEERHPDRQFELVIVQAKADLNPEVPLVALGGEGIFVKELEQALISDRIDLAVHSLKDLPLEAPAGLAVAAVLERDEMRDALIARSGRPLEELSSGSTIGTSSLRRRSQLLHRRKDLTLLEIRGNVDTRLRKLMEGQYDAIVVAACGLIRLGLEERITQLLDLSWMLPEPGQGALAIETRADDATIRTLVAPLNHAATRACVEAERSLLRALGGGCRVPIAAYGEMNGSQLHLEGAVVAPDGSRQLRDTLQGPMTDPIALGERLAAQLTAQGAKALLAV